MKIKIKNLKKLIKETLFEQEQEEELNFKKLPLKQQLKIIAQVEEIKISGKFDMFDFYNVQRYAYKKGYYELVNFTQNSQRAYSAILKSYKDLIKIVWEKNIKP